MCRGYLSVLVTVLASCLTGPALAREDPATVLRVIEGDTIEVSIAGSIEKVCLIGVDRPETVDPRKPVEHFGKEASEFTRKLVKAKNVILSDELGGQDRDKYNRLLRYAYLEDGTLVNAEIIKQGYGYAYVVLSFSFMHRFRTYERQAREKGLGLWGSKEVGTESGQARAPSAEHYVGSSQSNKYHLPPCVWAQKINSANLVTFKSPKEAQSRGYVPCRVCNPAATSTATGLDHVGNPPAAEGCAAPEVSETTRGSAPEQIGNSATRRRARSTTAHAGAT